MKNELWQQTTNSANRALRWLLPLGLFAAFASPVLRAAQPERFACSAPAYHQFDFWLGDWDVFEEGVSAKEAEATVTWIQDGCGIREQYKGLDGSSGESISTYDPVTHEWQQTWLSNRGQIVFIHGNLQGQAMMLSGTDHGPQGQRLVRGAWKPASDGVRETADRSSNGGKTWTQWFDLSFRPHSSRENKPQ